MSFAPFKTDTLPWSVSFAEAFCRQFGSSRHRYETTVLWQCLACRLSLVGRVINFIVPDFFADDREAIRRLGTLRSAEDFMHELDDLDYVTRRRGGFVRLRLGMRASVSRLDRLQERLFREQRRPHAPTTDAQHHA